MPEGLVPTAPQVQVPAEATEPTDSESAARRKRADSDGTLRRMRQTVEDNRLR